MTPQGGGRKRRLRSLATESDGLRAIPAPVLFVVGGLSMYVGAALAVGLFDRLAPSAVAVLRLIGAAAVLLGFGVTLVAGGDQLTNAPQGRLDVPPARCVVVEDAAAGVEAAPRVATAVVETVDVHLRHRERADGAEVARTEELAAGVMLDLDGESRVIGIELDAPRTVQAAIGAALDAVYLLIPGGVDRQVLTLTPPLTIDE